MVIKELEIGKRGTVELLVESVSIATAVNGNEYQKLIVKDTDGVKINVSNFKKKVAEKSIISGVLECSEYKGNPAYVLKDWEENKELNSKDFKPKARIDIDKTWKELVALIKTITDEKLCKLACKTLSNEVNVFKYAPLTASDAYSRVGGLMEATYKLMQLADSTAKTMGFDRNLLLAAASVYYIGSTMMVDDDYQPTREVALVGFDIAAHDKLVATNAKMKEEERLDAEAFQIFDNILLSRYQGKPTATPEAFALKMLDSIVTVVENGNKIIEGLNEGSFKKENELRMWYRKTTDREEDENE